MVRTSALATALALSLSASPSIGEVAQPRLIERATPAPNVAAEAEVGQPILEVVRFMATDTVELTGPASAKVGMGYRVDLVAGLYRHVETTKKGRYYQPIASDGLVRAVSLGLKEDKLGGILIPADGSPPRAYLWGLVKADGAFSGAEVRPAREGQTPGKGFKSQIIYAGIQQGAVKFTYREFVDDLARPAFTQDLTYDLSAGREIGFRGSRFRVVDATNVSITYVVERQLSAPSQ